MKNNKITKTIYVLMAVALFLLPAPLYLVTGRFSRTVSAENRTLATMPAFSLDNIESYPAEFEAFWEDHLPMKGPFVRLNGLIDYRLFRESGGSSVIVGKDGWLFYKGQQVGTEDPEGDYLGSNLYSEETLSAIRANLTEARDELRAQGTELIIFIAPNKERVYSEYMPDAYGDPAENNRLKQVEEELTLRSDLNVIFPLEELLSAKKKVPDRKVFFKYDTHWNNLGAYVGARMLAAELGHEMPDVTELSFSDDNYYAHDLLVLMGIDEIMDDDRELILTGDFPAPAEMEKGEGEQEFRFRRHDEWADQRKVMIIGDSFSERLNVLLAGHFRELYTISYADYNGDVLRREQPDVVIYEVVERYLDYTGAFDVEEGF